MLSKIGLINRRIILKRSHRFILDKVLHNYYIKNNDLHLFDGADKYVIFLIRKPSAAIPSLMEHSQLTDTEATKHYINRLACLEDYAKKLSKFKTCIAITHDQILFDTQVSLDLITRHLNLKNNLTENYELTRVTGVSVKGDSSDNIKLGKINRKIQHKRNVEIAENLNIKAHEAYSSCESTLMSLCKNINSDISDT